MAWIFGVVKAMFQKSFAEKFCPGIESIFNLIFIFKMCQLHVFHNADTGTLANIHFGNVDTINN